MAGQRAPVSSSYRGRRVGRGFAVSPLRVGMAAAGVLVLGLGGWGVFGRHSSVVPVIEADSSPIRVKPDNPGGMQVAGADELGDSSGGETMAPAAEAPAPQALRAQMQQAAPSVGAAVGAAVGATPAAGVPTGVPVTAGPVSPAPALAPLAVPANVPPPRRGAVAGTLPPGAGTAVAVGAPSAAARVEAVRPQQSAPAPAALAAPAPAPVAAGPAPAAAGGGAVVQLGALASEGAAQAEWQKLVRAVPELSGRAPIVQKTEHDGRTLWRLRTGGFADVADATAFCARVRGKGGACTIASF